jgi:hypothetical protein
MKAYKSWHMMKQRCDNPNSNRYSRYGGRGITYDPKWETFAGFLEDMGERPEGTSLDRINNDGNYEASNCRWVNRSVQSLNTRGKGVDQRPNGRWRAKICVHRKQYCLGTFDTEEESRDRYKEMRELIIDTGPTNELLAQAIN